MSSWAVADDSKAILVGDIHRTTPVDFEKEVLPILSTSCLACHNKSKAKAKLDLETPAAIRKGGESGPAAVPGKGMESLLLKAAAHAPDVDSPMPPPHNTANAPDLTSAQLGLIRLWIDQGANGEVHDSASSLKWVKLARVVQPIYATAVTGDGQFAACGRGNQIDIYNLPTGRLVAHLTDPRIGSSAPDAAHRDLVESLAFSPDGMVLASGSYREIKLWRRPTPVKKYELADVGEDAVCAAASADGNLFAVGDSEGKIRLFESAVGKSVGELVGHDAAVTSLCFCADGRRLVSTSIDKTARVWDVHGRRLICKSESPFELSSAAWIDNGKRIAVGGVDGIIRVWNVPESPDLEMSLSAELKGHEGRINALAENNRQLFSGGADGTVRIWDTNTGHIIKQVKHGAAIIALAVRKDGKRFASAGMDNVVRLWNTDDGKQIAETMGDPALLVVSTQAVRSLSLAIAEIAYCRARVNDAEKESKAQTDRLQAARTALAAAVKDLDTKQHAVEAARSARVAIDGEIAARKRSADAIALAEELVKSLATSTAADKGADADKPQLTAAADALKKSKEALGAMKLDDRKKAAEAAIVATTADLTKATTAKTGADQEVTSAGQTVDAAAVVLAHAKDMLKSADVVRRQREVAVAMTKRTFGESAKLLRSIAFSPDGSLLAVAGDDGRVRTLYSEKGTPGDVIGDGRAPLFAVAFLGDHSLITAGEKGTAAWELSSPWQVQQTLGSADGPSPIVDRVTSLDFSPDGKLLASGGGVPSRGGEVKLWDSADGKLLKSFDEVHVDTVNCVRFSPDGKRLACASADRFARVIDPATGKVLMSLEGHQHHVLGIAWRRDGHTIATAGADNTLRFWNADTGEKRLVLTTFDKELTSVNFIADTDLALITSGDGRVASFSVDGGEGRSFPGASGFVYAASVTPDGATVVAGGDDGTFRAWDAASGRRIFSMPPLK